MKSFLFRILQLKEAYQVNVVYTPVLMMLLFTVLALSMVWLDGSGLLGDVWGSESWFDSKSAHQVLGIIATAVITIISVVFSISILTLSIAANLLGPRLIPNFIRKGQTQFVIGVFTGTFVYSVIILASMDRYHQIPQLSVLIAIVLSFLSFIVLIYFIHFVCQNIQVEYTLTNIMKSLNDSIEREFCTNKVIQPDKEVVAKWLHTMHHYTIDNQTPGYIQTIDYKALASYASKHNMVIEVLYKPGDFLISDVPVIRVYTKGRIDKTHIEPCLSNIKVGLTRTYIQDVEFSFEQIAEIAIRALSPGINNPYTAMLCINYLSEGIRTMGRYLEPPVFTMDNDQLALIVTHTNYEGVIRKSFDRLRQQAKNDLSVTIKLIEMITDLCKCQPNYRIRTLLLRQADYIYHDSQKYLENEGDRADLDKKYNMIKTS